MAQAKNDKTIIFQLGTNNWQWKDEPAPGSGILHEIQHKAFNELDNVISYSIYPSNVHTTKDIANNADDLIRIYALNGKHVPICESTGPISKRRWHSMEQKDVDAYRTDLEKMSYDYLLDIEKKHGKGSVTYCIAHHSFMNPVIIRNVMIRREKEDLPIPLCGFFSHGTGLKMYYNEINQAKDESKKDGDFPMKFYPWIKDELSVFNHKKGKDCYMRFALACSSKILKQFREIFPDFEEERCIISYPGVNTKLFCKREGLTLKSVLKELALPEFLYDEAKQDVVKGKVIGSDMDYDHFVLHVGRLAAWKRPDVVIMAAKRYEADEAFKGKKVLTLMVGGGPKEHQVEYLKMIKEKGSANIHYVGVQMQDVLYRLFNVADVAVYPSRNEPFGMVFIETLSCGTPVIGCNSGGPKDYVTDKVGLLLDETDDHVAMSKSLAENVVKFVSQDYKSKMQKDCIECGHKFNVNYMQELVLKDMKKKIKN